MIKKFAIFVGGMALGAYVAHNNWYKAMTKAILDATMNNKNEEKGENVKDEK